MRAHVLTYALRIDYRTISPSSLIQIDLILLPRQFISFSHAWSSLCLGWPGAAGLQCVIIVALEPCLLKMRSAS